MKWLNVNIPQLVYQLIPPHKRQQLRVQFLQILTDIHNLYEDFADWRSEHRRLYNTSAQTFIFQGYLQYKLGEPHIYIQNRPDEYVAISLIIEQQLIAVPLAEEIPHYDNELNRTRGFPLIGEIREQFGDADYRVIAIPEINPEASSEKIKEFIEKFMETLIIEIEKFNVIDKKYIITLQYTQEEEEEEEKQEDGQKEEEEVLHSPFLY